MNNPFGHQLYNWHLEISSRCPLKCPRCTRTEFPGTYRVTQLGLDFIKTLFTPDFLKSEVKRITFSGGVGDPLYNSDLADIVAYIKSSHPDVQLVLITNGSHKPRQWWQNLLHHFNGHDEIIFSIDGWDNESNNLYRINSDWESIMVGLQEAVKSSALVRWSTIIFRFNEHKIEDIRELARQQGVDSFHAVLSERFGMHYVNEETGIDPLEPSESFRSSIPRTQRFKESFKTNPGKHRGARETFRSIDDSFKKSYEDTLAKYQGFYILPTCKFGYRGIYVDVEGILYPCSWVSHQFDKKASLVNPERVLHYEDGFYKYRDRLNLSKRSLQDVISDPLWGELECGWKSEESAFIICERKCLAANSDQSQLKTKPLKELS
ncbi:MAG: radical SAM protein [Bdellovibrionales bacterium]|nr:radical SAM protein [Bdellovibrionales bacterium]